MGMENLKKTMREAEKGSVRKEDFAELSEKEKDVIQKVKDIFQENAELNLLLCEGDLDLREHQKRYLTGQLTGFRREAKGVLENLRKAVPVGVADGYFADKGRKKAA